MSDVAEEQPTMASMELRAMRTTADMLESMPPGSRANVLAYLMTKYWPHGKWERGA